MAADYRPPITAGTQAAIDAEASARASADTALAGTVTAEAVARANADSAEATARANAITAAITGLALSSDLSAETTARVVADASRLLTLAYAPDGLLVGVLTRDANDAVTSAPAAWPDGATGVFTATTLSTAFPGAIDAYTITHVLGGTTTTYTQAVMTRNANGAVTTRPAITVV